jgi:hypothetical protein
MQSADEACKIFSDLLEDRFNKEILTTEDSVRYTLFHCLTKCMNLNPSNIILEEMHPSIPRAEVDMHILADKEVPEIFFEFKYDRAIPSEKNAPRPQKAGKIFADIFRLALIKSSASNKRYFVYVTDGEMATYFMNTPNRLSDFFNLNLEEHLVVDSKYVNNHCETFVKRAGDYVAPCKIVCKLSDKTIEDMWIRIYEIMPL